MQPRNYQETLSHTNAIIKLINCIESIYSLEDLANLICTNPNISQTILNKLFSIKQKFDLNKTTPLINLIEEHQILPEQNSELTLIALSLTNLICYLSEQAQPEKPMASQLNNSQHEPSNRSDQSINIKAMKQTNLAVELNDQSKNSQVDIIARILEHLMNHFAVINYKLRNKKDNVEVKKVKPGLLAYIDDSLEYSIKIVEILNQNYFFEDKENLARQLDQKLIADFSNTAQIFLHIMSSRQFGYTQAFQNKVIFLKKNVQTILHFVQHITNAAPSTSPDQMHINLYQSNLIDCLHQLDEKLLIPLQNTSDYLVSQKSRRNFSLALAANEKKESFTIQFEANLDQLIQEMIKNERSQPTELTDPSYYRQLKKLKKSALLSTLLSSNDFNFIQSLKHKIELYFNTSNRIQHHAFEDNLEIILSTINQYEDHQIHLTPALSFSNKGKEKIQQKINLPSLSLTNHKQILFSSNEVDKKVSLKMPIRFNHKSQEAMNVLINHLPLQWNQQTLKDFSLIFPKYYHFFSDIDRDHGLQKKLKKDYLLDQSLEEMLNLKRKLLELKQVSQTSNLALPPGIEGILSAIELSPQIKLHHLTQICEEYREHLATELRKEAMLHNKTLDEILAIVEEDLEEDTNQGSRNLSKNQYMLRSKFLAIEEMIEPLINAYIYPSNSLKLNGFIKSYQKNKHLLIQHRDPLTLYVIEKIESVIGKPFTAWLVKTFHPSKGSQLSLNIEQDLEKKFR